MAKPFRCNTYKKQGGYILQAKRFSPSAPFLQFGRSNVSTCKRFNVFPSYPLSFQPFTDSLTQRETRICFSFNHLRILSIATEGVPPLFPLWNSPPAYPPVSLLHYTSYFHTVTWNPFCKPFIFIFIRVMGGVPFSPGSRQATAYSLSLLILRDFLLPRSPRKCRS